MNKRRIVVLLLVALLLLFPCSAYGANAVPSEVLDARESVVRIFSIVNDGGSSGTGFAIGDSTPVKYVATNYHVVDNNPDTIEIWIDRYNYVKASIYEANPDADLCILKLDSPVDMPPSILEDINEPKAGDAIYALGFPGTADCMSDEHAKGAEEITITDGIISALKEKALSEGGPNVALLQINAAISHGNSGGPLLNEQAHIIGINTFGFGDQINAAISINELITMLKARGIPYKVNEVEIQPEVAIAAEQSEPEQPEEEVKAVGTEENSAEKQQAESSFPWVLVVSIAAAITIIILVILLIRKDRSKDSVQGAIPFNVFLEAAHIGIEQKLSAMLSLVQQVESLHQKGKFNLNICPENIHVLDNRAVLNKKAKNKGNICQGYAAIELYNTGMPKGPWTDVYAISAILYQIFNGYAPVVPYKRDNTPIHFAQEGARFMQLKEGIVRGLAIEPRHRTIRLNEIIGLMQKTLADYQPTKNHGFASVQYVPPNQKPQPSVARPVQNYSQPASMQNAYVSNAKRRQGIKKVFLIPIICIAALVLIGGGLLLYLENNYQQAVNYIDDESYMRAEDVLQRVPQFYKDSQQLFEYTEAAVLLEKGDYKEAKGVFEQLGKYKDAPDKVLEASYGFAKELLNDGKYQDAKELLEDLGGYKDAENLMNEADLIKVQSWLEEGKLDDAEKELKRLIELGYDKAKELLPDIDYHRALGYIESDKKLEALKILLSLDDYEDTNQVLETLKKDVYDEAVKMVNEKSVGAASSRFSLLSGYHDANDYLELIDLLYKVTKSYWNEFTYSDYQKLVGFKHLFNIGEYYMTNGAIYYFLEGRWKDALGNYFAMVHEDEHFYPYFNMPSHDGEYYDIVDQVFTSYKDMDDYVGNVDLRFEYVDEDTIRIYCYKNGRTYKLERE